MAAVASKNLTIRFIADVSKWKPQLESLKKELNEISKMKISPDFKIPSMPGVMRSPIGKSPLSDIDKTKSRTLETSLQEPKIKKVDKPLQEPKIKQTIEQKNQPIIQPIVQKVVKPKLSDTKIEPIEQQIIQKVVKPKLSDTSKEFMSSTGQIPELKKHKKQSSPELKMKNKLGQLSDELSFGGLDMASSLVDKASQIKAFGGTVSLAMAGAGAGVAAFGAVMYKTISVGNQTRDSIVQFKTLLGGLDAEEKALDLFTKVKKFGGTTPLELPQLTNATAQLLGVGIASDQVISKMSMLGDISQVTGKDFNELTDIYAKNKSTGLVQLGDLTQIANAKIPIFGVLAKQMNKTEMQIMKMASANQILFKDLDQAFLTMTSSGGLFFEGMKNKAKEIPGAVSNIKDSFEDIWRAISGADKGNKATSFWNYLTSIVVDVADYFGRLVTLIRPLLFDMGTYIGSIFMAIWDFGKMLWAIFEPFIMVLFAYFYESAKATMWILTTAFQTLSLIFKAVAWTITTIYSVVVWILELLYKIPFIGAVIDGIGESIFRLINWIQNVWIKFITIFTASMLYISLMVDLIKNADWVKIGDNIYKSITKSFDNAWTYIKTTAIYKFLEKVFQGEFMKSLDRGITETQIRAEEATKEAANKGTSYVAKVAGGVVDDGKAVVNAVADKGKQALNWMFGDNESKPIEKLGDKAKDKESQGVVGFLKNNQVQPTGQGGNVYNDNSKKIYLSTEQQRDKNPFNKSSQPLSTRANNKDLPL